MSLTVTSRGTSCWWPYLPSGKFFCNSDTSISLYFIKWVFIGWVICKDNIIEFLIQKISYSHDRDFSQP